MTGEAGNAAALAAVAAGSPAGLPERVAARALRVRKGAGEPFFSPGDACRGFVVVLSGVVRVEHVGASGRSVVLYRVGPGDTCVMVIGIWGWLGLVPLATAFFKFCPAYTLFGFETCAS